VRAPEFLRKASQLDFCSTASPSKILKQLNAILETRDTPAGLVAILADELFDRFTLRPEAREKLRRVTHLLLLNPGIRLGVELHTNGRGFEQKDEIVYAKRVFDLMKYLVRHGVRDLYVSAGGLMRANVIPGENSAGGRHAGHIELLVPGNTNGRKVRGAAGAA
jgi:hypothetical protein